MRAISQSFVHSMILEGFFTFPSKSIIYGENIKP